MKKANKTYVELRLESILFMKSTYTVGKKYFVAFFKHACKNTRYACKQFYVKTVFSFLGILFRALLFTKLHASIV